MSILINKNTRVVCQGITGKAGAVPYQGLHGIRHARWSAASRPAKAGETVEGVPVFDTVAEAVEKTGADATMIFVPAGVHRRCDPGSGRRRHQSRSCAITEGVPVLDMVRVYEMVRAVDVAC